jgi:hypothetical protein
MITGHNPFFWMDQKLVGSGEVVAAYCVGFIGLAAGAFSFMYGLISMREAMVERATEAEQQHAAAVRDAAPRRHR